MGPSLVCTITFVRELPVQRMKDVVRRTRPVGLGVVPIEVMVVDERAIQHHAAMRLQRLGQRVGRIRRRAPITRRSGLAF